MKKKILFLVSFILVSLQAQNAKEIFSKMISSIQNTRTAKFTFEKLERFHGKMHKEKLTCKVQYSPTFKVYCKQHYPKKGAEVLLVQGRNNNKVLVNPNSFPYVNLNLDPRGSVLLENQHHSLYETGFRYLGNVLEFLYNKYRKQSSGLLKYLGETTWNGFNVYKIKLTHPNFRYVTYTVKQGEDVLKIARRFKLSEYMILEINDLDDFDDVKAGQKIKIPVDYAKSAILYVDKKTYLPLRILIYDDKGLFEEYKYLTIQKNPALTDYDFSEKNKNYGF